MKKKSKYDPTYDFGKVPNGRMPSTDFGKKLREHRLRHGWDVLGLANRSCVPRSYVHNLEYGRRANPTLQVIQRLALALKIEPRELL